MPKSNQIAYEDDSDDSSGSENESNSNKNSKTAERDIEGTSEEDHCRGKWTGTRDSESDEDGYETLKYPGTKIPVRMRKRAPQDEAESVPEMQKQCPFPGRVIVTSTTDPIEKVTWGPTIKIEASAEAKDILRTLRSNLIEKESQPKIKKKATKYSDLVIEDLYNILSNKASMDGKCEDNPLESSTEPFSSDSAPLSFDSSGNTAIDRSGDGRQTPRPTSLRKRALKQPPSSPSETTSIHSLSTPTLPELHRASDPILVQQYLAERDLDPAAFDVKTKSIKDGLVKAKLARGGSKRLLTNEYTVELASRLDAEKSEKLGVPIGWSSEEQIETTSNTLEAPEEPAGESEPTTEVTIKGKGVDRSVYGVANASSSSNKAKHAGKSQSAAYEDSEDLQEPLKFKPITRKASSKAKTKDKKVKIPQGFDVSDHVCKITTSGVIRSQHSQRREIGDEGEKRVVKTWIEITETYEVPSQNALGWKDVCEAIEAEGGWKRRTTSKTHKPKKTKNSQALSKKGKERQLAEADDYTSEEGCDSESASETEPEFKASKRPPKADDKTLKAAAESLRSIVSTLEDLNLGDTNKNHLKTNVKSILKRLATLRKGGELKNVRQQTFSAVDEEEEDDDDDDDDKTD